MLAGLFVGSIFFVRLGDIYGRKWVLTATVIISTIALFGVIIPTNLIMLYISVFIFGVTASPRYALSYVYALELTTKNHEAFYTMLSMQADSSAMIILGIYFYFCKDMIPILIVLAIL